MNKTYKHPQMKLSFLKMVLNKIIASPLPFIQLYQFRYANFQFINYKLLQNFKQNLTINIEN